MQSNQRLIDLARSLMPAHSSTVLCRSLVKMSQDENHLRRAAAAYVENQDSSFTLQDIVNSTMANDEMPRLIVDGKTFFGWSTARHHRTPTMVTYKYDGEMMFLFCAAGAVEDYNKVHWRRSLSLVLDARHGNDGTVSEVTFWREAYPQE